jgi:protein SCO1/2
VYKVNNHTGRIFLIALILSATFLGSSCHRSSPSVAKRYPFTGHVVSIDAQAQSAIINGDAVPGFMDAMAMPYKIRPAASLNHLLPGDSISAEVVVLSAKSADDVPDYWLENVKVLSHIDSVPAAAATSLHMPAPGEEVPDFSFTNQDGKHISLKQFRGQTVLVTFIYTRCPFPDFCPRMSGNFAEIYKQITTNQAPDAPVLLSISFDPKHDTPKVLRDYAFSVAHTRDSDLFRRWQFAAPTSADLPRIATFFALTIKPEGGLITHNLSTAVIGPDGKIVKWYHGSDWQPSDLMKDVATAAPPKN